MRKLPKILLIICLCCSFVLTGCSLVQKNTIRYLDRTVATAGNEITINKQDLITAYNSYGYQYVSSYGYTTEKALQTVIDGLIGQKLLVNEAKKVIKIDEDTNEVYFTRNYTEIENNETVDKTEIIKIYNANVWQNEVWQQVYDSVNSQLLEFENTIRTEKGLDINSDEEAEEEKTDYDAEEVYESKVKYENGNFVKVIAELDPAEEEIGSFVQTINGDAEISASAWKRYIKALTKNEEGKNLDTNETNVFKRELERIYKIYDDSKYLSAYEACFDNYTAIDNNAIIEKYKELVKASYAKYEELGSKGYDQYVTDMQSDCSTVYYHPYGEKFVAVSHVLIKFTEDQLTELKGYQADLADGTINQEEYEILYANWKNSAKAYERDADGNEIKVDKDGNEVLPKTLNEIYTEIEGALNACDTVEEKAIAFNKFIYKYGQDTGIINATHYYAVNLDTSVKDTMVSEFAETSRALYEQGAGSIGLTDIVEESNYSGYHIVFNAGGISNNGLTINNLENITAEKLFNTKLMLGTNKTMYDYLFDTITSSNYSAYSNGLVETLKQNLKVTYYVSSYKDLY